MMCADWLACVLACRAFEERGLERRVTVRDRSTVQLEICGEFIVRQMRVSMGVRGRESFSVACLALRARVPAASAWRNNSLGYTGA